MKYSNVRNDLCFCCWENLIGEELNRGWDDGRKLLIVEGFVLFVCLFVRLVSVGCLWLLDIMFIGIVCFNCFI